jgi:hypothetical protein
MQIRCVQVTRDAELGLLRLDITESARVAYAWRRAIAEMGRLLRIPWQAGHQTIRNELTPRPLMLTSAASRLWIEFYEHVEARVGFGGDLEQVRGLANKVNRRYPGDLA